MGQKKSEGLDEWLGNLGGKKSAVPTWMTWPQAFRNELVEVLRRMDAGTALVSLDAMVRRARAAHGLVITRHHLTLYARQACNRTSWTRP